MIDTTAASLPKLDLKRHSTMSTTPLKSQAQRTEEEGGVIAETFFGQLQSFIHYKDGKGDD